VGIAGRSPSRLQDGAANRCAVFIFIFLRNCRAFWQRALGAGSATGMNIEILHLRRTDSRVSALADSLASATYIERIRTYIDANVVTRKVRGCQFAQVDAYTFGYHVEPPSKG